MRRASILKQLVSAWRQFTHRPADTVKIDLDTITKRMAAVEMMTEPWTRAQAISKVKTADAFINHYGLEKQLQEFSEEVHHQLRIYAHDKGG